MHSVGGDFPVAALRGVKTQQLYELYERHHENNSKDPEKIPQGTKRTEKITSVTKETVGNCAGKTLSGPRRPPGCTPEGNEAIGNFIVYHKNARGLSNDDRFEELLQELCMVDLINGWDAITLNESWRTADKE